MGHNFVVAHCRKVQSAVGLRNVAAHNCREAVYDRELRPLEKLPEYISHPERATYNQGDRCGGLAVLKRRTDRIAAAKLIRRPQKNASAAIEAVISATPDWFEGKSPKEWQSYFEDARTFLEKRYGKENILHWAVHCDEKTPHMHVLMAPIKETEKGMKYTSGEFLGGRKGLADLQERIWQDVGMKYGMERGIEGSKARHTDQYEWASEIAQERDNLHQERGSLDMVAKDVKDRENALVRRERAFQELSRVELPPFKFSVEKSAPLRPFAVYTASDGTEGLPYVAYVAKEAELQASKYAETALKAAKSKELAVQKELERAGKLPDAIKRIRELQAELDRIARFSPQQLRAWADKKELEQAQKQARQRGRDQGGREF